MHGGTMSSGIFIACRKGLSPHARGNHDVAVFDGIKAGSIPACTGEPAPFATSRANLRVYPRMHGGTSSAFLFLSLSGGLSPHARGNHTIALDTWDGGGSIPACTGEPAQEYQTPAALRVYPRMHGGTYNISKNAYCSLGLSPHARGNLVPCGIDVAHFGSIPACTGEPPPPSACWAWPGVYPRMHGGTSGRSNLTARV